MPGKARRVIRKYYEYLTTKVKLVFNQKKYKLEKLHLNTY